MKQFIPLLAFSILTSGSLNMPIGAEFHLQLFRGAYGWLGGEGNTITTNSTPALTTNGNVNDCMVTGAGTFTVSSVNGANTPTASTLNVTGTGSGTLTWGWYSGGAHSDPFYAWSNVGNGSALAMAAGDEGGNPMTGIINPNRDYFDSNTSVSGTPGVLVGLLSARPGSGAVTGQGYFAVDQGTWNQGFTGTLTWANIHTYLSAKWGTP